MVQPVQLQIVDTFIDNARVDIETQQSLELENTQRYKQIKKYSNSPIIDIHVYYNPDFGAGYKIIGTHVDGADTWCRVEDITQPENSKGWAIVNG